MDALRAKQGSVDLGSRREERRGYIEGGVRRVVGRGGFSVPGGEEGALGEGNGGRRAREEVEGLESVVAGVAGADAGGGERMEE